MQTLLPDLVFALVVLYFTAHWEDLCCFSPSIFLNAKRLRTAQWRKYDTIQYENNTHLFLSVPKEASFWASMQCIKLQGGISRGWTGNNGYRFLGWLSSLRWSRLPVPNHTVRPRLINHELFGACQKWSWEKEERDTAEGCVWQLGTSTGRLLVRKEDKMAVFRIVYQEFPIQIKFQIFRKSFSHDMYTWNSS